MDPDQIWSRASLGRVQAGLQVSPSGDSTRGISDVINVEQEHNYFKVRNSPMYYVAIGKHGPKGAVDFLVSPTKKLIHLRAVSAIKKRSNGHTA